MPRQVQLDISGALHQIVVRGINKADIFDDDQDKTRFLEQYASCNLVKLGHLSRGKIWPLFHPYFI